MPERCGKTEAETTSYLAWDQCFDCMPQATVRGLRHPELLEIATQAPLFLASARFGHIPPLPPGYRNPDRSSSIIVASGLYPQASQSRGLAAAKFATMRSDIRLRSACK